jgi:hypothetical protein
MTCDPVSGRTPYRAAGDVAGIGVTPALGPGTMESITDALAKAHPDTW